MVILLTAGDVPTVERIQRLARGMTKLDDTVTLVLPDGRRHTRTMLDFIRMGVEATLEQHPDLVAMSRVDPEGAYRELCRRMDASGF